MPAAPAEEGELCDRDLLRDADRVLRAHQPSAPTRRFFVSVPQRIASIPGFGPSS